MPSYPLSYASEGSVPVPREAKAVDFDGNNEPRIRKFADSKTDFVVHHKLAPSEDYDAVMDCYVDNELSAIDYVWPLDGQTYSVKFEGEPRISAVYPGGQVDFSVKLLGV